MIIKNHLMLDRTPQNAVKKTLFRNQQKPVCQIKNLIIIIYFTNYLFDIDDK